MAFEELELSAKVLVKLVRAPAGHRGDGQRIELASSILQVLDFDVSRHFARCARLERQTARTVGDKYCMTVPTSFNCRYPWGSSGGARPCV